MKNNRVKTEKLQNRDRKVGWYISISTFLIGIFKFR